MNMLSACWTLAVVLLTEASTIQAECPCHQKGCRQRDHQEHCPLGLLLLSVQRVGLHLPVGGGPGHVVRHEHGQACDRHHRVPIIFGEKMDRNAKLGAAVAVSGVFAYSLAEESDKKAKAAAAAAASKKK